MLDADWGIVVRNDLNSFGQAGPEMRLIQRITGDKIGRSSDAIPVVHPHRHRGRLVGWSADEI
jgi:hypothetical protein